MIKREELTNPASCMNRALDEEPTFVLLGRDIAAPHAIREWAALRLREGKNEADDPQIREAFQMAQTMEQYRAACGQFDPGDLAEAMEEFWVARRIRRPDATERDSVRSDVAPLDVPGGIKDL